MPGCTCIWTIRTEGELNGELMESIVLMRADRRCAKHGKPRHADSVTEHQQAQIKRHDRFWWRVWCDTCGQSSEEVSYEKAELRALDHDENRAKLA